MYKIYFGKKRETSDKKNMLQSIVGVGDILVYEISRNNNQRIINALRKLYEMVENLFSIKKADFDRFIKIVLSEEYLELYQKDKDNAQFNLAVDSEKYADGFSTIIDQVVRVYKKSVEENNIKIARFAIYILNKILALLSKEDENDLFVEQTLRRSSAIVYEAINKNDLTIFDRAISLYRDVVFDHANEFKICYLKAYDNYLFSIMKIIITENKSELFNNAISSMIDGFYVDLGVQEVWDYGHLLLGEKPEIYRMLKIDTLAANLNASIKSINSIKKLDDWSTMLNGFVRTVEPNLSKDVIRKAEELELKIIKSAENQFKINNLKKLFFTVAAFCLLKKRIEFINFLWNYKHPEDSDATWIGHDLIPENLDDLMLVYFGLLDDKVDFFTDHHGSTIYIKNYFLLLLCRFLQSDRKNSTNHLNQIDLYRLPVLDIHRLSDLTYRCDDLLSTAKDFMKNERLLTELGFEKIEDLFNEKVIPFIEHIKNQAVNRISELHRNFAMSQQKIEEFKNGFVAKFYEMATVRDIITSYFMAYRKSENKKSSRKEHLFGLNIIEDKAVFFESWNVCFSNIENSYAQSIAVGEDRSIFQSIMSNCQALTVDKIEDVLSKFVSLADVVILASGINILSYFNKSASFYPAWKSDVKKLNIKGFEGWYEYNGQNVPVFNVYNTGYSKVFLVLSKSKFGTLFQYSPLKDGDDATFNHDIFYINIMLLVERKGEVERLLNKAPEWLAKVGDHDAQKGFLQERVIIEINESFEFVPAEDFIGYKWDSSS